MLRSRSGSPIFFLMTIAIVISKFHIDRDRDSDRGSNFCSFLQICCLNQLIFFIRIKNTRASLTIFKHKIGLNKVTLVFQVKRILYLHLLSHLVTFWHAFLSFLPQFEVKVKMNIPYSVGDVLPNNKGVISLYRVPQKGENHVLLAQRWPHRQWAFI